VFFYQHYQFVLNDTAKLYFPHIQAVPENVLLGCYTEVSVWAGMMVDKEKAGYTLFSLFNEY